MLTRKHLRRAQRRMAAWPAGAPAVRRAVRSRLARTAAWSADDGERATAAEALAAIASYGWGYEAFARLGIRVRARADRPVTPLRGPR